MPWSVMVCIGVINQRRRPQITNAMQSCKYAQALNGPPRLITEENLLLAGSCTDNSVRGFISSTCRAGAQAIS